MFPKANKHSLQLHVSVSPTCPTPLPHMPPLAPSPPNTGESYLNFMGNEFGHPEWIDFPRDDSM